MNNNQDLPNIQMIVSALQNLQNWWKNIHRIYRAEIRGHLGALLSLLGTRGNKVYIIQLMGFWDPNTVTFKFSDFEITLTLLEFSSFTELPIKGRLLMILSSHMSRFGRLEGYDEHQHEFA
ncbi:hypothetical protein R3W88_033242 [Solanum pinnatisectum]|uniref:DUF7745 domain-containing protein n=1 Tax=Solanum pinnatisectum TaxID=50273 RepID=A0AAV9K3D3_9SOLN|nr:hypothetical protein R3W88_033242 [Solanum pinnatisectum]